MRRRIKVTRQKSLDQFKDEFIGLVSHELRTPLTVIIGSLNTVMTGFSRLSTEEIRQLLRDASLEAEALSHLVSNLVELSRSRAEALSVHAEPVRLELIVHNTVDEVKRRSPDRQFVVGIPSGLPVISADPQKLENILYNLLDNAVKYSPDGSEVQVFARTEGNNLLVGVVDRGSGISPDDQDTLFEAFHLEREGNHGAGLGLAVCQRLVEAHGGRIWVESKSGQGSTFYFLLPLETPGKRDETSHL